MNPSAESRSSGPACAAVLAAALGLLALALAQVLSEVSAAFKSAMQILGDSWMPGAAGIGPYSGKETVALLVWLISWAILHVLWKPRELSVGRLGTIALALIGIATTLVWPPVTELFVHHSPR
jgi:hypothetical protein